MLFKRCLALALCLVLIPAFALAGEKKEPRFYWKSATLAPEGIGWSKHMKDLIFPEMEKVTKGDLKVKVYWGGIMGDEEDYIKKIRIGQLQGAGLSAQGTFMACPEMSVVELPFLFNNYNEVDYVRVKMEHTFDKLMAQQGFFLIGWIDQDFDQIYSAKFPMTKMSQFKRSRFLTWYGPIEEEMFQLMHIDCVPVNVPEIAVTVRQGVVDASIGPAVWVVGAQLYSRLKFVNPVKIRYSPATIINTLDSWNELPQKYRDEFNIRRLELGWRYCNLIRRDNKKFLDAMVAYGVQKSEMTPDEMAALQQATKKVWPVVTGKLFPKELLDEVLGHLADFRNGKRLTLQDLMKMTKTEDIDSLDPEFRKRLEETVEKNLEAFGAGEGALVNVSPEKPCPPRAGKK